MPEDTKQTDWDEEALTPSKSELKRQMHARQQLGESLLQLNEKQLAEIPIEDEQLLEALAECKRIRSNSARKRHLQYIGKLMRGIDPEPIEAALAAIYQPQLEATQAHHELEALRDDVLAAGVSGVEVVMQRFPDADRQHLRQLVLQHQKEMRAQKPPAASRKLFRYLRDLQQG